MSPELRFNPLKGEWVLFAPKRQNKKKPKDVFEGKRKIPPKSKCPFEHPEKSGNLPPYFQVPEKGKWNLIVFPNKFPGVSVSVDDNLPREMFHMALAGYGYHDLLVTRDHGRNFSDFSEKEIGDVFRALKKRYAQVSGDPKIQYVAMFQNWGASVGASLYHPHMQIIALPIIPSHIASELVYAFRYFEKKEKCLYCESIKAERKEKRRIVFEDTNAIAFVPYAAQEPYEVLIFPKKHMPFFELTPEESLRGMARAFKNVLRSIKKNLNNPDYNFYIHTAPATDGGMYPYHHWYLRILPKSNYTAGFELGTGIEINTVFPEDAAKLLKI